tara:strand:- start:1 stop:324 length:324 start_codon:yes stop_codon:yes gene_type:complete
VEVTLMKLEMPWSGWFNKQAKKRRKIEPWVLAKVSIEEEFEIEMVLREVFNYIDPDDIPDLISAFAMENYRLTKIINQAGDHIDKIYDEANDLSPKSKHNPLPKLPH